MLEVLGVLGEPLLTLPTSCRTLSLRFRVFRLGATVLPLPSIYEDREFEGLATVSFFSAS